MRLRLRITWNLLSRYMLLGAVLICLYLSLFMHNDSQQTIHENSKLSNTTRYELFGQFNRKFKEVINSDFRLFTGVFDTDGGHGSLYSDSGNVTKNSTKLEGDYKRRLPQAIIIGVKKCGTRALLEYLRLHPSIKATGPEPHFFDRYYHLGLEWYSLFHILLLFLCHIDGIIPLSACRQKMPKSSEGHITIEKTPRYFVTAEVPRRICSMSKSTKLILVVRDPVTRAISDFTQAVSKGEYNDTVTFGSKAVRKNGAVNAKWSAINIGLYAYHMRRWLDYFPTENVHIVDGEHLIRNPIHELNLVQDFLGLERKITSDSIYWNSTKGFPCIVKPHKTPRYRCFKSTKGRQHSYADDYTLNLLHNFYEPHNKMFYAMVKRNFRWRASKSN
ncbi:hypothetical protein ACF0H5_001878 [Mactra antiquata]